MSLTSKIFVGMVSGLVLGILLHMLGIRGWVESLVVEGLFYVVGSIFLASLKLLVVPLVFVSLVCGTAALDDVSKLGRVGGKTVGLYLLTTALALILAVLAAVIVRPGDGFELTTDVEYVAQAAPTLSDTLIGLFPENPIRAMAEGNMLQVIVFSILFGLAVTLSGDPGRRVVAFFEDLNATILKLVMMLMSLAPYGVFCLIARDRPLVPLKDPRLGEALAHHNP